MIARIRAALSNESGNFMIQTLVGSIVSLTLLGVMGASIMSMTMLQAKTSLRLDITNQAALTDAAFRNDVLWASSINATDGKKLEMIVPRCRR